jgi:hypothetical protein
MSRSLAAALAAAFLAGCASYRLGPTGGVPPGARSVQVDFFKNSTAEPRLLEAVNSALRKRLQQDGTLRLDTRGGGDIVMSGALVRFERTGVSFQPGDVITARDFNLALTAHIKAVERASGKVLLDREVRGRTTIRAGSDLASAERQAIPLLAEDLARNATTLLVEGIW